MKNPGPIPKNDVHGGRGGRIGPHPRASRCPGLCPGVRFRREGSSLDLKLRFLDVLLVQPRIQMTESAGQGV